MTAAVGSVGRLLYCSGPRCQGWTRHEKIPTTEAEEYACLKCDSAKIVPGAIRRDFQTAETALELGRLGYLAETPARAAHAALIADLAQYGYRVRESIRHPLSDSEASEVFEATATREGAEDKPRTLLDALEEVPA